MRKFWLHIVVVLVALYVFQSGLRPPHAGPNEFDIDAFAHLPVKSGGRKKPIDTLARNLLSVLSEKQSVRTAEGEKRSATQWFLENISGSEGAFDYPVFRIENIDVLTSVGLVEKERFRYSYNDLVPAMNRLNMAAASARQKDESQLDLYDRQILKTVNKIALYQNVMAAFEDPARIDGQHLQRVMQRYQQLSSMSIPLAIPPDARNPNWRPLMSTLLPLHPAMANLAHNHALPEEPMAAKWQAMLTGFRGGDPVAFNQAIGEYYELLQAAGDEITDKLAFEVFYNRLSAFMKSSMLYLVVFVIACFGWLFRKPSILAAALTLMIVAFIPHTFAIIARVFLSGYPPVTNLYSSAIFIGWAAVAAGIVIELFLRKRSGGMGVVVGGIAGFITLLIAHFLAGDGDTLEQLRAVLDTRFWLATHVITITLGYMAMFVAGTIGLVYIVAGLLTRRIDRETRDGMYRMAYGVTCFGLLLSFVGTVLGGLWADDSWGRFWGWDPKENGALLIVLWAGIMLHAKYSRMVKHRGFAMMAVFGNAVTAWSWFGVNQLGIGLHSYGFTDSAAFWLMVFILSQLGVIAAAALPAGCWRSAEAR